MPTTPNYESVRFDSADAALTDGVAVRRWDAGELRAAERTPEGYLRAQGILTKAGVFEYIQPDGTRRRELRPPEEVFDPESLRSFGLVPLTNDHPPDNLTTQTVRDYQVGSIGSPERAGESVRADVLLTDPRAIADAERGKTGLSAGYTMLLYRQPGTFKASDGTEARFDAIQTRIRGNHTALCWLGKAGDGARIRMDSADAVGAGHPTPRGETMTTKRIKIGTQEFEVPESVASAVGTLQGRLDAVDAETKKEARTDSQELSQIRKELDQLKGERDAAQAELKKRHDAEAQHSQRNQQVQLISDSVKLFTLAQPILDKPLDELVRMDAVEVMRLVVKTKEPDMNIDGKSDDYVRGIFEHVTSKHVDTPSALRSLIDQGKTNAQKSQRQDSDLEKGLMEARQKMQDDLRNSWKTGSQSVA